METVYKYRSGDDKTFERDIKSIEKNYFWGSNISDLNDPVEALVSAERFKLQTEILSWLSITRPAKQLDELHKNLDSIISRRDKLGVYSLSKTYKDELLWAHYANSHKGFCIEYDLTKLLQTNKVDKIFPFWVEYSNCLPEIAFEDLSDKSGVSIIKKIVGYKSKRWDYEEEFRIIIDESGKFIYNHEAVKAIYFGVRMEDTRKKEIINRLRGRGLRYYQISQVKNSYRFERNPINDENDNHITYLRQLPQTIARIRPLDFQIIEKDYNKFFKTAEVTIRLKEKSGKNDLLEIATLLQENLFWNAEKMIVFYFLSNQEDDIIAWATVHFQNHEYTVSINSEDQ